MTSDPVVLAPDTTVAEALARARDPDLTPALASLVFVVRPHGHPDRPLPGLRAPPGVTARTSGQPGQRDRRQRPAQSEPGLRAGRVTRYFAAYNLVCGPVVDNEGHLLGAVTVDDVLDHLLPLTGGRPSRDADTSVIGGRSGERSSSAPGHSAHLAAAVVQPRPGSRGPGQRVGRPVPGHRPLSGVADHHRHRLDSPEPLRGPACAGIATRSSLLNLAFSTQAAYAAPLILLAQNRQENRDKVSRRRTAAGPSRPRPTPSSWPRRLAALRLAVGEVATRDYLRRELEEVRELLETLQPAAPRPRKKDSPVRQPKKSADHEIRG